MKTKILEASVDFLEQPFLNPIQISSGLITKATEARVTVTVRVGASEGTGCGSIYLSDLWAWPGAPPSRDAKDASMRELCRILATSLADWCGGEEEHPLELGLRLHHSLDCSEAWATLPLLARAVCASPFDAAIHDAAGHATARSAFHFYENDVPLPSADAWFVNKNACDAIRRTLRTPLNVLDAWWLISAKDDLEKIVHHAIAKNGISRFKIKVLAKDNAEDAARTAEVFRRARNWGLFPILSIDSNEGNPHADSVADYLDRLESLDPEAYAALAYLEQPTTRDILASPQNWTGIGKRKPILLDEGLTSLEILPFVKEQGWSGLALKTCKGHSFALVSAAWAKENSLALSLQDLTNPGYSGIHSFLLGAHISTLNGIELNSPQYTPAANQPWLPRLSGLFEPKHGVHRMEDTMAPGLGSSIVQLL